MFVGNNLYVRFARHVDLSDQEFFSICLDAAKRNLAPNMSKDEAPIVFCSQLKSQTAEEVIIARRSVHDPSRAKRRFLMIDADYDAGQEHESDSLRNAIMRFGKDHQTPVMIYPSFSFPDKPRFRAVFLVSRLLDDRRHYQAMSWLYEQLDFESTDPSDLRITTNRNLPVFRDDEMADAVYSTFDDESLEPLDHQEFFNRKDLLPPKQTGSVEFEPIEGGDVDYDEASIEDAGRALTLRSGFDTYAGSWYVIASVAFDMHEGRLTAEQGDALMAIFAENAPDDDTRRSWEQGNRLLLEKHLDRYQTDPDECARARPLYAYAQARDFLL